MADGKCGNYSSCCRLCLTDKYDTLNSIFGGYSDSDVLLKRINLLLGVEISCNDKVTTLLCSKCFIRLNSWEEYKRICTSNQTKLQGWLDSWNENMAISSYQIKEEPTEDDGRNDDVINLDDEQEPLAVKSEPIDPLEEVDMYDLPPPLTPHPPETNPDEEDDMEIDDQPMETPLFAELAEVTLDTTNPSSKICTVCDKSFSTSGNRRKHEKVMHGLHGGRIYVSKNKQKHYSPNMNGVFSEDAVLGETVADDEDDDSNFIENFIEPEVILDSPNQPHETNGPMVVTEKDEEKIMFAAGLCLQSKSAAPKQSQITKLELNYLEKCKIMITMFYKNHCVCHNMEHKSYKKILAHLRQHSSWFPSFTCYNCLVTFDGRSAKMKHFAKCPRLRLESLIRLSEMRARTEDKIRLYQNFKCIQCNFLFSFYDDYIDHVDNYHVEEEGPFTCICEKAFDNSDEFRQHIHKSCYINYFCDVCCVLCPTLDEFKQHCEESHDAEESFQFFQAVSPKFTVLNNIEIANILLEAKENNKLEEPPQLDISEIAYEQDDSKVVNPISIYNQPTQCTACDKVYSSYHNMLRHARNVHNIDPSMASRPTTCPDCGNKFSTYYNMLRHRRVHEDSEKSLQCPSCPERFRLATELKEHGLSVHLNIRTLHRCNECGESFKNSVLLHDHELNVHVFSCEECGKDFTSEDDLEQHRSVHLNITLTRDPKTHNYQSMMSPCKICQVCDKAFTSDYELQIHMSTHDNEDQDNMPQLDVQDIQDIPEDDDDSIDVKPKKFDCIDCDKSYFSSRGLWEHNKKYHPDRLGSKEFPKQCDQCERTIQTLAAWIMHKQMHQRMLNAPKIAANARKTDQETDYHTCKRCFKVFASKYNLKTHMKMHGINVSPTRTYMKTGKFVKTFWCDVCHQACQGMNELNRHKLEHLNEDLPELENEVEIIELKKPVVFRCGLCPRAFSAKAALDMHKESHQETGLLQKQVYCKYCKIPFDSSEILAEHMRFEHDENEPAKPNTNKIMNANGKFACDLCRKMFNTSSALCSHQGWHKRGKVENVMKVQMKMFNKMKKPQTSNYRCVSCSDIFDNDTSLQLHILEAHRNINTSVINYRCSKCNIEFGSQHEFEAHELKHLKKESRAVLCVHCNKTFSRSDYLSIHISKQHPEMSGGAFQCNHCDRVFEKQNALSIHLKVHERHQIPAGNTISLVPAPKTHKYSCSICHIGFDIPKELRNHIIASHPF